VRTLAGLAAGTLAITGFVLADGSAAMDPVRQFERDRRLIAVLVDGGLQLAGESDPFKRADTCNGLADQLAQELQRAAADRDARRAAELSRHLHAVLVRGVASNVQLARSLMPANSTREREFLLIGKQTARFTQPAEDGLRQVAAADTFQAEPILQRIQQGQAEVDRACRSRLPFTTSHRPAMSQKTGGPKKHK
jgi:hypothetical protein